MLVGLANRAEEAVGTSRLEKSPVHIYKCKWTQTGRDFWACEWPPRGVVFGQSGSCHVLKSSHFYTPYEPVIAATSPTYFESFHTTWYDTWVPFYLFFFSFFFKSQFYFILCVDHLLTYLFIYIIYLFF